VLIHPGNIFLNYDFTYFFSRMKSKSKRSISRTLKEVAKPTYYMKSLEYYLKLSKKFKNSKENLEKHPFCQIYKEHFIQSVAAFKFINRLRIPTDEMMETIKVKLAELNCTKTSKNILLIIRNENIDFWYGWNFNSCQYKFKKRSF